MKMIKNMVMLAALTMTAPLAAETTEATETENAAPATVAEIASGVCAGCHSADGNSVIPMNPILAGQHAEYITKQLIDFKATENAPAKRNSPIMSSMVAALSPEDMKQLGDYYAQQKAVPSQVAVDDDKLIELGKLLYHGGSLANGVPACASCHGPNGSGIPPRYPAIAGQHAEYTITQLNLFNTGDRANDKDVMQQVITRLNGYEKRAVSTYISTMR
ncbi:MAG: c-type cytochrome [Nitrosomonas sp.]|uniref:c-type cytochrome n=1 Tax=Nitrosomonas sp. TaxID=42353 RepID=UPI00273531D5|nr:c-type cytochrome [Nitrosomonas sp.]MDP1934632.1 c-type cytochrome [Nitrosomonas sp.]MDP3280035.1 c-type cytochrome [Nitrosomonas sp.]MDP3662038.1 c-type cytochrome [Nitrosomonas sp.]MDZ4106467.1 c-type cytochrome [Nitrosomonas sp.]